MKLKDENFGGLMDESAVKLATSEESGVVGIL